MRSDLTCVCVDDSQVEVDYIKRILSERGVRVVAAERDGQTGLDAIRRLRPDFATLDIVLPHITGIDILSACLRESIPTQIAMCTSMTMLKAQAMAAGARHFIAKPYDDVVTWNDLVPLLETL